MIQKLTGENSRRVERANNLLREFALQADISPENAPEELLHDLLHWCHQNGTRLHDTLESAALSFDEETCPRLYPDVSPF